MSHLKRFPLVVEMPLTPAEKYEQAQEKARLRQLRFKERLRAEGKYEERLREYRRRASAKKSKAPDEPEN